MAIDKVAVVIVTFNRIKLFQECLECVLNQKHLPTDIIIVNNASTDGTIEYLQNLADIQKGIQLHIINLKENVGGAGGFYEGLKYASQLFVDGILLIDDDAMIYKNYLENICNASKSHPNIHAFSGTVITNNQIVLHHRRYYSKDESLVPIENYKGEEFEYDLSSFCGLILESGLVKKIGFPRKDFFIWYDDTEYSFRINKFSRILNVNSSQLNHKTGMASEQCGGVRKLIWKDYYGCRNIIRTYIEHIGIRRALKYIFHLLRGRCKELFASGCSIEIKVYNCRLTFDAIIDGVFCRLGKNKKYLP